MASLSSPPQSPATNDDNNNSNFTIDVGNAGGRSEMGEVGGGSGLHHRKKSPAKDFKNKIGKDVRTAIASSSIHGNGASMDFDTDDGIPTHYKDAGKMGRAVFSKPPSKRRGRGLMGFLTRIRSNVKDDHDDQYHDKNDTYHIRHVGNHEHLGSHKRGGGTWRKRKSNKSFTFQNLKIIVFFFFFTFMSVIWYGIIVLSTAKIDDSIYRDRIRNFMIVHTSIPPSSSPAGEYDGAKVDASASASISSSDLWNAFHSVNEDIQNRPSFHNDPQPKLSKAAKKYMDWKTEHEAAFQKKQLSRQQERIQRIAITSNNESQQQQKQLLKPYYFHFLNDPTRAFNSSSSSFQEDNLNHYKKQYTPCGISAQSASSAYPSLYPDIHTLNENSTILITGILSKTGYHLALKLATECNIQNIIGIDPILPNDRPNRFQKLNQLHTLYNAIPKMFEQNLFILPFAGLNPKNGIHSGRYYDKYRNEDTGELDFSMLLKSSKITHVVHISSMHDYKMSTFEGSDSVYIRNRKMTATTSTEQIFDGNPMFGLRQSLMGIDHLLSSFLLSSERNAQATPIHFTLVSDVNVLTSQNGDDSNWNNDEKCHEKMSNNQTDDGHSCSDFFTSTSKMEEILFQSYKNKGIDGDSFVTLRLPFVYGPWGNSGSVDYDLAEWAVQHWDNGINSTTTTQLPSTSEKNRLFNRTGYENWNSHERDVLFVDDAVNAILTAMQYQENNSSPDSFNILSGEKASSSTFAKYMEQLSISNVDGKNRDNHTELQMDMIRPPLSDLAWKYLNFDPKVNIKNGIIELLAWHLNQHLPHGQWSSTAIQNEITSDNTSTETTKLNHDMEAFEKRLIQTTRESGYQFLKREKVPYCKDDESRCLRGHHVLPCASECSDMSLCRPTGFDDAKIISQDLTKHCARVLYTSSFGPDIKAINVQAPEANTKDFCTIAFVSKDSKLMKEHVERDLHNGWHLVPVDFSEIDSDSKISSTAARPGHKRWLPKLSPGKLFHPKVRYAVYLGADFGKSPTIDDIIFIIGLMVQKHEKQKIADAMVLVSALEDNLTNSKKALTTEKVAQTVQGFKKSMSVLEAKQKVLENRGITQQKGKEALQRRISLYQQIISLLNKCEFLPNCVTNHVYKYKLRHWVKMKWVVHNLQMDEAKDFRCEWYKEHTMLEKKRKPNKNGSFGVFDGTGIIDDGHNDFDEFSFAHVMAMREIEHFSSLDDYESGDPKDDLETKRTMLEQSSKGEIQEWIPLGREGQQGDRSYVRIMDTERLVEERKAWDDHQKMRRLYMQKMKKSG